MPFLFCGTLFAFSANICFFLRKNVIGLFVKRLCETRLECTMENAYAVKYETTEICNVTEEITESTNDV